MLNPGRTLSFLGLLLLLASVSMQAQAQQQRVEVQLSANRVSIEESVILSVRAYALDAELDASALTTNFDVTTRSSSRQITIENGKRTSVVEWILELIPRRIGALEVPPIVVGSEQSRPLTLLVEQPASGSERDLFVEASVDVSDPYVQAQVIYTLRVFQDVRFLDASLSMPDIEGAIMQQLGDERTYQDTVNGRNYAVSEIRYSVFPKQSGKVEIPSIALKAVVPVDRNQVPNTRTRTRTLTRRAENVVLNVRPRPDGLEGNWWLPAKEVKLQSAWSAPVSNLAVDQPITRTVHLMAQGVADSQLPQIEVPEVENISIYADTPTAATNISETGLMSQQTNTWAVIAQVPGELVLPEVRVNWFDTTTGEARVAVLPEEIITVTGPAESTTVGTSADGDAQNNLAVDSQQNTPSTDLATAESDTDALAENGIDDGLLPESEASGQDNETPNEVVNSLAINDQVANSWWKSIAIGLLAGWVLSLVGLWLWWRSKRDAANDATTSASLSNETDTDRFRRRAGSRAALSPIKLACESGDASKISQQVLAWGAMVWPKNPPTHIADVAKRLNHQPLSQLFEAVDAEQYRPSGSVKPVAVDAIPEALRVAVENYREPQNNAVDTNALPAL